jgi:Fasciclin domain
VQSELDLTILATGKNAFHCNTCSTCLQELDALAPPVEKVFRAYPVLAKLLGAVTSEELATEPLTLFAPTNEAFDELMEEVETFTLEDIVTVRLLYLARLLAVTSFNLFLAPYCTHTTRETSCLNLLHGVISFCTT